MRNRWLRWPRSLQETRPPAAIPAELTSAFLDMDQRQAAAQTAVDAASALDPHASISREWESIREQCYGASAAYLHLITAGESVANPEARAPAANEVQRRIDDARRGVDAFYERHRPVLDGAASAATGVAAAADGALATAHRIRRRLEATDQAWASYPSVLSAHDQLEARAQQLQLARQRGDLAAARAAVEQLIDSAALLDSALDAAPGRAEQARHSVASVRTRIDALRTRASGVPPVLSTLLREFHANSSADLLDNERNARTGIDHAAALLQQATTALTEKRPEAALELVGQARAALKKADELVDAVSERLAMLRAIREDPGQAERDVRFRLRDAQRLAVDRGVADEWGGALDAQAARIDRIAGSLAGRNPDYWGYQVALHHVSDFISDIVSRIRQRSAQR